MQVASSSSVAATFSRGHLELTMQYSVEMTPSMAPGDKLRVRLSSASGSQGVIIQVPADAQAGDGLTFVLHEHEDGVTTHRASAQASKGNDIVLISGAHDVAKIYGDAMQEYQLVVQPHMPGKKWRLNRSIPGRSEKVIVLVPDTAESGDVLSFAVRIPPPVITPTLIIDNCGTPFVAIPA